MLRQNAFFVTNAFRTYAFCTSIIQRLVNMLYMYLVTKENNREHIISPISLFYPFHSQEQQKNAFFILQQKGDKDRSLKISAIGYC